MKDQDDVLLTVVLGCARFHNGAELLNSMGVDGSKVGPVFGIVTKGRSLHVKGPDRSYIALGTLEHIAGLYRTITDMVSEMTPAERHEFMTLTEKAEPFTGDEGLIEDL